MANSLEKKRKEMKEMVDLIPKMQNAVRNGLKIHFKGEHIHNKKHVEEELGSLRKAIKVLDSKYVLDIIFVLSRENEILFFNELKSILHYVNVSTLSKRLKSMKKDGIIERKVYPDRRPIRVSYELTKMGHGIFRLLLPLLVYITYCDEFKKL